MSGVASGTADEELVNAAREGLATALGLSSVDDVSVLTVSTTLVDNDDDDDDDDADATPAPVGRTPSPAAETFPTILGDQSLTGDASETVGEPLYGDGGLRQRNRRLASPTSTLPSPEKSTQVELRQNSMVPVPPRSRRDVDATAAAAGHVDRHDGLGHRAGFLAAEIVGGIFPASGGSGGSSGGGDVFGWLHLHRNRDRNRRLQTSSASGTLTVDMDFEVVLPVEDTATALNTCAYRGVDTLADSFGVDPSDVG